MLVSLSKGDDLFCFGILTINGSDQVLYCPEGLETLAVMPYEFCFFPSM